jgi:hypothetical protein
VETFPSAHQKVARLIILKPKKHIENGELSLKMIVFLSNQSTHQIALLTNSTKNLPFKGIQHSSIHRSSKESP